MTAPVPTTMAQARTRMAPATMVPCQNDVNDGAKNNGISTTNATNTNDDSVAKNTNSANNRRQPH